MEAKAQDGDSRLLEACRSGNANQVASVMKEVYPPMALVEVNPSSGVGFLDASTVGNLLHWACANGPPVELIRFLIQQRPQQVLEKDSSGYLPLHWACGNGASLSVVQLLLDQYPGMAKIRAGVVKNGNYKEAGDGHMALHEAVYNNANADVIRLLLDFYPEASQCRVAHGLLPLQLALQSNEEVTVQVVQILLTFYPQASRCKDYNDLTPLAQACFKGMSPKIIRVLRDRWPEAIGIAHEARRALPIHMYLYASSDTKKKCCKEVIQMLASPASLAAKDAKGMTALHLACHRASEESLEDVIEYLVEKRPEGTLERCSDQYLPIHYAVSLGSTLGTLTSLVKAGPGSLEAQDPVGRTPLFLCCEPKNDLLAVQLLYQSYPKAVEIPAKEGSLPLHTACIRGASADVIRFLVEAYPQALQVREKNHCYTPFVAALWLGKPTKAVIQLLMSAQEDADLENALHGACTNKDCPLETIEYLSSLQPEALQVKSTINGRLPLHTACYSGSPLEVITFLVEAWPESIRVGNCEGMLPLHEACGGAPQLDTIRYLLEAYPESIRIRDTGRGRFLPLHWCCRNRTTSPMVYDLLLAAYPESIQERTHAGELPFHLVAGPRPTSHNQIAQAFILRLLAQKYPEAMSETQKTTRMPSEVSW